MVFRAKMFNWGCQQKPGRGRQQTPGATSLPYTNSCAASWLWTALSVCYLGFPDPAP